MTKVIVSITMSVDGFVAGRDISVENPLGIGGHRLHHWLFHEKTAADSQILHTLMTNTGAVILGNHTYRTAIDDAWSGVSPFQSPAYVLCYRLPASRANGFTFVTGGIEEALVQAKAAAGLKQVWIMGGANVVQQYLKAGLVDELHLHLTPVLLNQGTRLFAFLGNNHIELEARPPILTKGALHTTFDIVKSKKYSA